MFFVLRAQLNENARKTTLCLELQKEDIQKKLKISNLVLFNDELKGDIEHPLY